MMSSRHAQLVCITTFVYSITSLLPSAAISSYAEDRSPIVGEYFSGAIEANTLLIQAQQELAGLGFRRDNSIRMPWPHVCTSARHYGQLCCADKIACTPNDASLLSVRSRGPDTLCRGGRRHCTASCVR